MTKPALQCWWDGEHIADFTVNKGRGWDLRCRYTPHAVAQWPTGTPLLSCSLPVQVRPIDASNFLRGLLPEGNHLQALASLAGVPTNDTYSLLARYGRDVAGALVIANDGSPSDTRWDIEPYDGDALAHEVAELDQHPLGVRDDSELSIAGLQNKMLLVELGDGRWGRPLHGYPSTHILKVDDRTRPGLVAAEASCLTLAYAVGLTNAPPRLVTLDDRDCLIVTRYDRRTTTDSITRIHQEDACQALDVDINANRGRGKYEDAGGPSLHQIATLLRTHSRDPRTDLEQLVRLVTFTTIIGNADVHGKNISLLHERSGHVALAPAYDTVPTMLWPALRRTAAMSVHGKRDFDATSLDDIAAEAQRWGLHQDRVRTVATELAMGVHTEAGSLDGNDALTSTIRIRCERLTA